MQVYVCVICKVKEPPLYVLSVEHRKIFEAILSSAVNIEKLKKCRLLVCEDCQRLIQTVLVFQQTALVGVHHLLHLLSTVQQKSILAPKLLQVKIKNEPDEPDATCLVREEVETLCEVNLDLRLESEAPAAPAGAAGGSARGARAPLPLKLARAPQMVKLMKVEVPPQKLATVLAKPAAAPKLVPILPRILSRPAPVSKSTTTPVKPAVTRKRKKTTPDRDSNSWYIQMLTDKEVSEEREAVRRSAPFVSAAFRCEPCLRTFASGYLLDEHGKQHLPAAGALSCAVCGLRARTAQQLAEHSARHVARYRCGRCPYGTPYREMVEIHACDPARRLEPPAELRRPPSRTFPKLFKCRHCFAGFCHDYALAKHMAKNHAEPPKPAKCKDCGKMFKSIYLMKRHAYKHKYEGLKGLRPDMFCKECKIPFSTQAAYRNHLTSLKHSSKDDRKFECDYCGTKCPNKTAMVIHIKSVHTKERKYKCPQCPRAFVSRSRLVRHAPAHAPGGRPRPHVCDQCGKAFMVKGTLRQHMNSHYGLRPYKCKLCPATFSFSGAVYTHTRLKHLKIKKEKKKEPKTERELESLDNTVLDENS